MTRFVSVNDIGIGNTFEKRHFDQDLIGLIN